MKQFYVYIQCRPSGEPFYVGKGHGKRAFTLNRKTTNKHYCNTIKKYGAKNCIVYVRNCRSEAQALKHEVWLIAWCNAQGFRLANLTAGGDGISGYRHTVQTIVKMTAHLSGNAYMLGHVHTPEARAKMSASRKGNTNARGKQWSPAARRRVSAVRKKVWADPDYYNKMCTMRKGRVPWNKGFKNVN